MKRTARLVAAGGVAIAATALFTTTASASPAHHGAVFVQTDGVDGNAVVAYDRAPDGTLSAAGTYATGGTGGVLAGSVVDHLASQGAVLLDRGLLYTVNAGSDTLTVFTVHGDRLASHQVTGTGGSFPVSVTAHGNLVYVLNARDGGSIQGFLRVGDTLVRIPAWHRSLHLDPTATPEFTHTPGQVAFTPDGTKLVVTTKGASNAIDVFGVDLAGGPSARPVVTPDANTPFAVTFDAHHHLVVGESGTSSIATYTVHRDGTLGLVDREATGQAATCWVAPAGGYLYTSNAGSATLSGYRAAGSGSLTALGTTGTDAGTVDAAGTEHFLYAETGAQGIVDEFRVNDGGSLTPLGSVTVPGAAGAEGIAAS
ncbi:MAG TPA: hypothetical protein VHF06_33445 [Pseudonocardiaceae bacterium]|nr:hypothetical protein [Pseudonocardiaceae bacterium]